ncbi:hypothetical protein DFJ74DRAFT_675683 [Hyaloraphidium curvatum]|nr:hypothetical protein DFJ74DRAFT_675683 [Hyaloraphidium curvatum]
MSEVRWKTVTKPPRLRQTRIAALELHASVRRKDSAKKGPQLPNRKQVRLDRFLKSTPPATTVSKAGRGKRKRAIDENEVGETLDEPDRSGVEDRRVEPRTPEPVQRPGRCVSAKRTPPAVSGQPLVPFASPQRRSPLGSPRTSPGDCSPSVLQPRNLGQGFPSRIQQSPLGAASGAPSPGRSASGSVRSSPARSPRTSGGAESQGLDTAAEASYLLGIFDEDTPDVFFE